MPGHRRMLAAALLAAPVAALPACSPPNESPSDAPGTTPSVWSGSPAPSADPHESGESADSNALTTTLKAPNGAEVATAKFEFGDGDDGYATVTVTTVGDQLAPGFHGLHLHEIGKCEPKSVAPTGGEPGDFNSAGGHFHTRGHTGEPASGDLTSLQVRSDGGGLLVTTTDAFTRDDLLAGDGTALVIHAESDNFGNIPSERYTQPNGEAGPDHTTMSTGDSGKRAACGVLGSG